MTTRSQSMEMALMVGIFVSMMVVSLVFQHLSYAKDAVQVKK